MLKGLYGLRRNVELYGLSKGNKIKTFPIVFRDNFDRDQTTPATKLENSPISSSGLPWTWDGIISGGIQLIEQNAHCETSNSIGTAYIAYDHGTRNHYVQYAAPSILNLTGSFMCCRMGDRNNFVGIRTGSESGTGTGVVKIFRRNSGTLKSLYVSGANAITQLDIVRLECREDTWSYLKNGILVTTGNIGVVMNGTKTGIVARTISGGGVCDDFESSSL